MSESNYTNPGSREPMSFEAFKDAFKKEFVHYLPASLADAEIKEQTVQKDRLRTGISVLMPVATPASSSALGGPVLYYDDMYKMYESGASLSEVLTEAAHIFDDAFKKFATITPSFNLDDARNMIIPRLISRSANADYLENKVFDRFEGDTVIAYQWVISMDETGIAGTCLEKDLLGSINVKREEIKELAIENMERLFVSKIRELPFTDPDKGPFIVTNNRACFGAAMILSDAIREELAEQIGEDVIILPTTKDECMVMPVSEIPDPEMAAGLLNSIHMGFDDSREIAGTMPLFMDHKSLEVRPFDHDIEINPDIDEDMDI